MQLHFGGQSYRIHFAALEDTLGEIDHTRGSITLDPGEPAAHLMPTLAHEAASRLYSVLLLADADGAVQEWMRRDDFGATAIQDTAATATTAAGSTTNPAR